MKRLCLGAPIVLVLAAGCAGGNAAESEGAPQTAEAAQQVLDQSITRSAAGDHAGTWELFVPEEQALISRDDYVEYQSTCNPAEPHEVTYEITDVTLESPERAVGTAEVPGAAFTLYAYYIEGTWHTTMLEPNRAGAEHWAATHECLPPGA